MSEIENQQENHEILDEATQEAAMPEAQYEARKGKKGRKKKAAHEASADEALASPTAEIEWNEATADLSFIDEAQGESQALNHFEELARRVAETVSRNQGQEEHQDQTASEASGLDISDLSHELVAAEPSIAEMIAAELDATADGIADTSAEIHAEMLAGALDEGTAENDATSEITIAAAAEAEAEGFDIDAELGEASEADRPAEQMEFAALEEELGENDAAQEPQEFIDSDQLISIIESLLFSTDKPVSIATIKQIFKNSNVRTKDITRAMDILASEYASSQRGVTLEEINGGYQLRTKSDNTEFLRRLAKVRPFRLSGPALEVLSIVAYKQPVSKHEIDEIRGVESGHLVRALMERSLMCFNGKSENLPGKPMTYGTTRKFLETFGLRNLKELPTLSEIDEILPEGIGEEVEKETLSDLTDRMSTELTSSYSEGEDELLQIAVIASALRISASVSWSAIMSTKKTRSGSIVTKQNSSPKTKQLRPVFRSQSRPKKPRVSSLPLAKNSQHSAMKRKLRLRQLKKLRWPISAKTTSSHLALMKKHSPIAIRAKTISPETSIGTKTKTDLPVLVVLLMMFKYM
jgi:segregation and condensation protein B